MNTSFPRGGSITHALTNARRGAARAGRSLDDFYTAALVNLVMLRPEEIVEQLRALESQGLNAISFITPQDLTYRVYEDFARKVIAKM
mgnify:CR=1 FL=1